jgi:uncharacterized protein (TIGR02217 family)
MAFFEQQLDTRITSGAVGGPQWSTTVTKTQGGARSVNRNWVYPLHRYNISQALRTEADFETVRAFFYVVGGQADGFRFKDWADYRATQANSSLTFIVSNTWQLNRVYSVGARSFVRPIRKPVTGRCIVYRDRSGVITVASTTVDYTTGIVAIGSHVVGDTYTWAGEFDVPVAFTSDVAQFEMQRGQDSLLVNWQGLEVEEIR